MSQSKQFNRLEIILQVMDNVLGSRQFDACILVVDNQGLLLASYGTCPSVDVLQAESAVLVEIFEETKSKFHRTFGKRLNLSSFMFEGMSFYIDDLVEGQYYLVARHYSLEVITKAIPLLRKITDRF